MSPGSISLIWIPTTIAISFEESRKFVHKLELKNQKEWQKYASSDQRPAEIPNSPSSIYKNKGWINIGDFIGTGAIATTLRNYLSYKDAKNFVRKLKFMIY